MQKIEITNYDDLKSDISALLERAGVLLEEDRSWFAKVYAREVLRGQHYAQLTRQGTLPSDGKVKNVVYQQGPLLKQQADHILDWLVELKDRNPRLHAKLARINFQQAYQHSEKWHTALAKAAEKSERYVEPDEENAPKAVDLGDGWEVFWLKTDLARDIEGEVMGHCVGGGGYDNLDEGEAIFSIRKNNVSHITLHMHLNETKQAVTKGNRDIPARYHHVIEKAKAYLIPKLVGGFSLEEAVTIPDGLYEGRSDIVFHVEGGLLSRNDGPALICGTEYWYQNGLVHREDGPAIVYDHGDEEWLRHGKYHREDGPARVRPLFQMWYIDGKEHREDGPAVIYAKGGEEWRQKGRLHRDDGPAMTLSDGTEYWYTDGKLHRDDGPAMVLSDGTQYWYTDGELNRENGPAVIFPTGEEKWFRNGVVHRDGGPAVSKKDGSELWYQHGKLHREDGPAAILGDAEEWYRNGALHRDDGPAVIWKNGTQEWWIDDKRHRDDGPAVIKADGTERWYLEGDEYTGERLDEALRMGLLKATQADNHQSPKRQLAAG